MPRSAVAGSKDPWSIQVTADITCQRRWWPGLSDIPSAAGASTWGSTLMGTKWTGARRAYCHCWSGAESPSASACPMLRHAKREPIDQGDIRQAVIGDRDRDRPCHTAQLVVLVPPAVLEKKIRYHVRASLHSLDADICEACSHMHCLPVSCPPTLPVQQYSWRERTLGLSRDM